MLQLIHPLFIILDYDFSTLKGTGGVDIQEIHLMERISDSNSGEVMPFLIFVEIPNIDWLLDTFSINFCEY